MPVTADADHLPPLVTPSPEEEILFELAVGLDYLAKAFPTFSDPVHDQLNSDGHHIVRTTDATAYPARKLGILAASWSLDVVGEGPRAEAVQEIVRKIPKLPGVIQQFVWALAEGIRFGWMKAKLDKETGFVIPSITVHRKAKAGGYLEWDGETIVRQERWSIAGEDQEKTRTVEVPRDRVLVFRPSATASPEGDTSLGWLLYLLAEEAHDHRKNRRQYGDRHGKPWELIKINLDKMRPAAVKTKLGNAATKLETAHRQGMAMSFRDLVELIEPTGETWKFLVEWGGGLAKVAHQLWLLNALTSDTAESGPTGSSKVHQEEEALAVAAFCRDLSEALTAELLPFILRWNADRLPAEGTVERLKLIPPSVDVTVLITDVLAALDRGVAFDAVWFYELFDTTPPPGSPEVITRSTPMFDPSAGFGGFGGAGRGGDDDEPDEPDEESDDNDEPPAASARQRPLQLAAGTASPETILREQDEQAEGEVGALAKLLDGALEEIITGGDLPEETVDLLTGAMAAGHLAGTRRTEQDLRGFLEGSPAAKTRARTVRARSVDQDELDQLGILYRERAHVAKLAASDNLRKRILNRTQAFIDSGGSPGDTKAFAGWLRQQQPDLSESYARLILRNASNTAYTAGRNEKYHEVGGLLGLHRQIFTAGDASVRDDHALYHGKVLPPGREFDNRIPPFDHNCRCTFIITDREPDDRSVINALPVLPFNQ